MCSCEGTLGYLWALHFSEIVPLRVIITCHAVSAVRGTPAAASKPKLAGMSATSASGMAMYSA